MRIGIIEILQTICAILVGVAFYCYCPLNYWGSIIDGLLVFLGLVVASLVQVISITASFLQAETLSSKRIEELQGALDRQQNYWLGLLSLSIISAILLVVAKFRLPYLAQNLSPTQINQVISRVVSAMLGFLNAFIAIKFFGVVSGIKSLQTVRFKLALEQAKERESRAVINLVHSLEEPRPLNLPAGFGEAHNINESEENRKKKTKEHGK